jgi:hypothetical protein
LIDAAAVSRPRYWPPGPLAPLLGFRGDIPSEVGRRTGKHRGAKVGKSRLQLCIGKAGIDLPVEPVDNLDERCFGRATPNQPLAW